MSRFGKLVGRVTCLVFLSASLSMAQDEGEGDDGGGRAFAGLNFGVGLSLTEDIGGDERVKAATVENGIVRITEDDNSSPRVMLESHYFFQPLRPFAECEPQGGKSKQQIRNEEPCLTQRAKLADD